MVFDFFAGLFFSFFGARNPEAVKKRRMQQLGGDISRNRYARFYKPRYGEAGAALGQFFYDIYKIIAAAQIPLQNAAKSALLKQIVVESFFDEELTAVKDRLALESIEERAKILSPHKLINSLKDDSAALSGAFDSIMIKKADFCYANILCMAQFAAFDFYSLVKKFDSSLAEWDFSSRPDFSTVSGIHISDELKDFLEVSFAVDPDQDWAHILWILKVYRDNTVVVEGEQWQKLLDVLKDVRRSGILELVVRHIDEEPDWEFKPKTRIARIAEKYLEVKQSEARAAVNNLALERKSAQRNALTTAVFGNSIIQRTMYYTESASADYDKKNFEGFIYAAPINYLLAFLLDIFAREIHDLCDFLIIRGKWIGPDVVRELTEHFYLLMEYPDELIAFDENFSERGSTGSRLKATIAKLAHDKNQARFIVTILTHANEAALELINTGVRSIIATGKIFNALLEDRRSATHTCMMNWRELEENSPVHMVERLSGAYNKILYFVQLMYYLTKNGDEQVDE